jgi:hypothetical protein
VLNGWPEHPPIKSAAAKTNPAAPNLRLFITVTSSLFSALFLLQLLNFPPLPLDLALLRDQYPSVFIIHILLLLEFMTHCVTAHAADSGADERTGYGVMHRSADNCASPRAQQDSDAGALLGFGELRGSDRRSRRNRSNQHPRCYPIFSHWTNPPTQSV